MQPPRIVSPTVSQGARIIGIGNANREPGESEKLASRPRFAVSTAHLAESCFGSCVNRLLGNVVAVTFFARCDDVAQLRA